MRIGILIGFILFMITHTVTSQELQWNKVLFTANGVNPTFSYTSLEKLGENYCFAYTYNHRLSWSLRSLGDLKFLKLDANGNILDSTQVGGNVALMDFIPMENKTYVRLFFFDSMSLPGTPQYHFSNQTRQLIATMDSNLHISPIALLGDSFTAMTVNSKDQILLLTGSGFGGEVHLEIHDSMMNLLQRKSMSDLGYCSQFFPIKETGEYLITGSCMGFFDLDGIQNNDFGYNNYILKVDTGFKAKWLKKAPDITCLEPRAWSDGNRSYYTNNLYLDYGLDSLAIDGPNQINEDFLLASIISDSLMWQREVPSDTGWYGVSFPAHTSYLDVDEDQNIYLVGSQRGRAVVWSDSIKSEAPNTTNDIIVFSYDTLGNLRWAHNYGGIGYDQGLTIKVLSKDNFILSAGINDTFMVGTEEVEAPFGSIWLARFGTDAPTSIHQTQGKSINSVLYPNPAGDRIFISGDHDLKLKSYTIYSLIGQKVFIADNIQNFNQGIDITSLGASQHYIVELEYETGSICLPFYKQ